MCSFLHRKCTPFITNGSFFDRLCLIDPVFLIFRWKKHTVNRKESTSVRPSKREHTETKFISVSGMVIYFCKKFRFFLTVAFKHRIIDDQYVGAVL